MKLEQAARQVVDAWDLGEFSTRMDEAITALREALAEQAEQEHDLYTNSDKDRPSVICDRNGEVVLALCKRCGRGECELVEPCVVKQAEQEPVAWILTEADGTMDFDCQPTIKPTQNDYDALREGETFTPLYAAPVRTKGLTDAEVATLIQRYTIDGKTMPFALCEAVIAADREKNK